MGGPVILFDQPPSAVAAAAAPPRAMVLGYFSNFLTGSCVQASDTQALEFGLLGSITSIPANYSSSMMLYFSADGINAAVEGYGAALLEYYGKPGRQWEAAADDVSVQSLGYYTDNGAFYYYNTPGLSTTFESELVALAAAAKTYAPRAIGDMAMDMACVDLQ